MTDAPPPAGATTTPAGIDTPATAPAPAATTPTQSSRHRVFWTSLNSPFTLGFTVTLGVLVAIAFGAAFSSLSTVVIYIVFALFAALGLDPVVRLLESRGVKRTWGIVIVYFLFALVLVAILMLIIPTVVRQIAQFIQDIPATITDFQNSDLYAWLSDTFGSQIGSLLTEVQGFLTDPGNLAAIGGGVFQVGVGIATTISGIIIILVLSLYFLATLPVIKQSLNRLVPARSRPQVADITEEITDSIGGYLMGMVILAFVNAVVAFFLHLFIGLPFPALMAVVAFCITLIPLIGSVLFWGIATGLALFTGWLPAVLFAAIYLVYMQLEAYVLTPRVMNRTISVPGSLVVIGALVGGTLLGLLGALVAIPVTASILLIIKKVWIPRQDAKI